MTETKHKTPPFDTEAAEPPEPGQTCLWRSPHTGTCHDRAILQFSGGKDSLAVLYLARPWLDKIEVHFANPGAWLPDTVDLVERTCEKLGVDLKLISPPMPIDQFHELRGLPLDVVPEWYGAEMARFLEEPRETLIQTSLNCCLEMVLKPLHHAVMRSDIRLLLRGTKRCDERVGIGPGTVDGDGIEYAFPIWEWSDDDVLEYLKGEGAEIPRQYLNGANDGIDCWFCTGHLRTDYAADRMRYLAKTYPEFMPEIRRRAEMLKRILTDETERTVSILDMALEVPRDRKAS